MGKGGKGELLVAQAPKRTTTGLMPGMSVYLWRPAATMGLGDPHGGDGLGDSGSRNQSWWHGCGSLAA
jgi:hypothetical protein